MSGIQQAMFFVQGGRSTIALSTSVPTSNYNLFTQAGSPAGVVDVTLTINSGGYLFGSNASNYALDTGTGWAAGSTLTVINNGGIYGSAGAGANETASNSAIGNPGGNGGPAINAQYAVSITNNSIIAGGGGGGGGGGNFNSAKAGGWVQNFGGNGGGFSFGAGSGGGSGSGNVAGPNSGGQSGGIGGQINNQAQNYSITGTVNAFWNQSTVPLSGCGGGGGGGGLGSWGGNGQNAQNNVTTIAGGTGGTAGNVVNGASNVTWTTPGARYGTLDSGHYNYFGNTNINYSSNNLNPAQISLTVNTSGQMSVTGLSTSINITPLTMPQSWYKPTTAGIGTSYWTRLTVLSGNNPTAGDAINTWLQVTANRVFTWTSLATPSTVAATVLVEMSTSVTGSPVVTSGTYNVNATHT